MALASFANIPLTITRSGTGGHYQSGRWVTDINTSTLNILCSIQPYRQGTKQNILPEGVRASDALWVWTQTPIQTINEYTLEEADRTIIDSREYVAFEVENWDRHTITTLNHYKSLFIRADKVKAGGL